MALWSDYTWIVVTGSLAAFFTAYGIGANDVANAFGSSVAARTLTMRQALLIAAVCEFSGSVLLGSEVTRTVASGIASLAVFERTPEMYMYGMLCAMVSSGTWLIIATYLELPVSTTHSIAGAVLGFAFVYGGPKAVVWLQPQEEFPYMRGMVPIVVSWFVSPLLSGLATSLTYFIVRTAILRRERSLELAFWALPLLVLFTVFINAYFVLSKGADSRITWSSNKCAWVSACIAGPCALLTVLIGMPIVRKSVFRDVEARRRQQLAEIDNYMMRGSAERHSRTGGGGGSVGGGRVSVSHSAAGNGYPALRASHSLPSLGCRSHPVGGGGGGGEAQAESKPTGGAAPAATASAAATAAAAAAVAVAKVTAQIPGGCTACSSPFTGYRRQQQQQQQEVVEARGCSPQPSTLPPVPASSCSDGAVATTEAEAEASLLRRSSPPTKVISVTTSPSAAVGQTGSDAAEHAGAYGSTDIRPSACGESSSQSSAKLQKLHLGADEEQQQMVVVAQGRQTQLLWDQQQLWQQQLQLLLQQQWQQQQQLWLYQQQQQHAYWQEHNHFGEGQLTGQQQQQHEASFRGPHQNALLVRHPQVWSLAMQCHQAQVHPELQHLQLQQLQLLHLQYQQQQQQQNHRHHHHQLPCGEDRQRQQEAHRPPYGSASMCTATPSGQYSIAQQAQAEGPTDVHGGSTTVCGSGGSGSGALQPPGLSPPGPIAEALEREGSRSSAAHHSVISNADSSDKKRTAAAPGGNGVGAPGGNVHNNLQDTFDQLKAIVLHGTNANVHDAIAEDEAAHRIHMHAEVFDPATENAFKYLQILTAICDSFSHGANDVANSVGPFAAIWLVFRFQRIDTMADVPIWILVLGGVGIVVGLATYGYNIIRAIGVRFSAITPSRGFCIELSTALVVALASKYGLPISTTHCQVGATAGMGLMEGTGGLNWRLALQFFLGWVVTLLLAGLFSAALFAAGAYAPSIQQSREITAYEDSLMEFATRFNLVLNRTNYAALADPVTWGNFSMALNTTLAAVLQSIQLYGQGDSSTATRPVQYIDHHALLGLVNNSVLMYCNNTLPYIGGMGAAGLALPRRP